MNELIESILGNLCIDNVPIPVKFMHYDGHDEMYVVYMQQDMDGSLTADDELQGYVAYYDFDVYAKGNYTELVKRVKAILKENGFVWQPSRSSMDMYEADTGYYHKTLNFAFLKEEN